MKKLALIAACTSMIGLSACSWTDKSYYEGHQVSSQDLERLWGSCDSKQTLDDGTEKWVYRIDSGETSSETFYVKNGRVVRRDSK